MQMHSMHGNLLRVQIHKINISSKYYLSFGYQVSSKFYHCKVSLAYCSFNIIKSYTNRRSRNFFRHDHFSGRLIKVLKSKILPQNSKHVSNTVSNLSFLFSWRCFAEPGLWRQLWRQSSLILTSSLVESFVSAELLSKTLWWRKQVAPVNHIGWYEHIIFVVYRKILSRRALIEDKVEGVYSPLCNCLRCFQVNQDAE